MRRRGCRVANRDDLEMSVVEETNMTALQELRGALEELGKHLELDIPKRDECVIDTGLGDAAPVSGLESDLRL